MGLFPAEMASLGDVTIAFLCISVVTVSLRCYVRTVLLDVFRWDDGLMLAALIMYIISAGLIFAGIENGTGMAEGVIADVHAAERGRLIWYLKEIMYGAGLGVARMSIGLYLLRVTACKWHIWLLYLGIAGNALSAIIFCFVTAFDCKPISFYWTRVYSGTQGHCMPIDIFIKLGYLYTAVGAAIDLGCCLLPIDIVRRLDVDRRTKIGLSLLLGAAGLGGVAALIRIPYLKTLADADFLASTASTVGTWSSVEYGIAISTSSAATLRPLFWSVRESGSQPQFSHTSRRTVIRTSLRLPSDAHELEEGCSDRKSAMSTAQVTSKSSVDTARIESSHTAPV